MRKILILTLLQTAFILFTYAQSDTVYYTVDFSKAKEHVFIVEMKFNPSHTGITDLYMPSWTPGYYQILNFADNIQFVEYSSGNKSLPATRLSRHSFRIPVKKGEEVKVKYAVLANVHFIARPYIDTSRAFIRPTGVFLYPEHLPSAIAVISFKNNPWNKTASGLKQLGDTLIAHNRDELMDAPILAGNLDTLKTFYVKGIPHYFSGRDMGNFDRDKFIQDVEKIVKASVELIQDIPYECYHFIAIGKGNGGIEQTNSTAVSFNGDGLNQEAGRQRILNFITHEYFHHFNVKRIRPIELEPFNYQYPNRTGMLWVGEGLTVYYEAIIMNRAGLKSRQQMLDEWGNLIGNYENNDGKIHQSLYEASTNTWEDGPFGIRGKTISVYEKGVLMGMLLDISIRHASDNKHSLDDVMRTLYKRYYKEGNRGYTEEEFKNVCREFAGTNLDDVFEYVYSKGSIDYNKFFINAGLEVVSEKVNEKIAFTVKPIEKMNALQLKIFNDLFRK